MVMDIKKGHPSKKTIDKNQRKEREGTEAVFKEFIRFGLIGLTILVFSFGALIYGIYFAGWQNSLVDTVASKLPLPIASVQGKKMVYLDDYIFNSKAIKRFLESKEAVVGDQKFDFGSEEGLKRLLMVKKSILSELIENQIIKILAEEKGINFSISQAETVGEQILNREGKKDENMVSMRMLYGWRREDFIERVVLPLLYREKLEEVVKENGYLDLETKSKVEDIKKQLASGAEFAHLAEKFSDSPSKSSGGLLPAFALNEAPFPELKTVFGWSIGKIGEPFETEDGWHFVRLDNKKEENGIQKIEIRHIFLKKKPFSDWLEEQKKEFSVKIFLPEYYWHQKMGRLYFKDDRLNEFEVKFNRAYYEEKAEELNLIMRLEENNK